MTRATLIQETAVTRNGARVATLPGLEPCTCGHPQGDHRRANVLNLNPDRPVPRPGVCQVTGCTCLEFTDAAVLAPAPEKNP